MKRLRTLYVLFAVSGFCGLIYESIWSHYLKLFLGHAAYAQTVVLIVFIGGLALGSWIAGAFAQRLRRPLLAYAAVEFAVGVTALVFHNVFVASTGWAYAHLLPAMCSAQSWCWTQWIFAGLLILPQSILLGTTFPLMTGGVLRLDAAGPGGKLSLLYFLNSIGAVAGVIASGFVLIPSVGLPGALLTAGTLNVALAVVVYFVDKGSSPTRGLAYEPATAPGMRDAAAPARMLLAIALLTGFSSFVYEVAWIRSLSLVLGSSTHSFELMLASFILGLALGGLWIRKRIDRIADVVRFLAVVQVVMGLLAVATLPTYGATYDVMAWMLHALRRSEQGWVLFNVASSAICLAVMLPTTFMAGMTLPLITFVLLRSPMGERSIGQVYAANTLGGILGVIVAVHFALPHLGLKGTLILGGAVDVALGIFLLAMARGAGAMSRFAWSTAGVLGIAVALFAFQLDPLKLASGVFRFGEARLGNGYQILSHQDGKTATVDVFRASGLISIATNGKVDGAVRVDAADLGPGEDEYTMIMLAALPIAYRPDARTAAIIGYGTGMSTATILGSPNLERVDTIEIEPAIPRAANVFRFYTEPAYSDPRSHIIIDDAKSYFARSQKRYDVILSEPSNPWVSGVSSLFTREFYARIRGQLNGGGIFVQWLHTYSFSDRLLASVIRALRESFPRFTLYTANNGDLVLVASPAGALPELDPRVFQMGRLSEHLRRIDVRTLEDLRVRRVGDQDSVATLFATERGAANSDYFPLVDTGASKALFLQSDVRGIVEVATAAWPILEIAGAGPHPSNQAITLGKWPAGSRVDLARLARHARMFALGEATGESSQMVLGDYYRTVELFKGRFIDCRPTFDPAEWRDVMTTMASLVSVYLSSADSDAVWDRVRHSPCYGALDGPTRQRVALFQAIGRRDAKAAAAIALSLLEELPEPSDLEYIYGAALTSLIGANRPEEALWVYRRFGNRIALRDRKLGWYRWLENAALKPTTPARADSPSAGSAAK